MKIVMLRIAVPEENAQDVAERAFKDARDMYAHLGAVVLNARVETMSQEDKDIYDERTAEEG